MNYPNEEKKEPRYHCFMFVSYQDPANYSKLFDGFSNYAFIKHADPEDLHREDGEDKQAHWHILIWYKNARTLSSCVNKCIRYKEKTGQTIRVERAYDTYKAFLYLTHSDPKSHTEGKHLYSEDDIVSYDISWWHSQAEADNTGFTMQDFISDMFEIKPLQMALRYGRDYIKNFQKYQSFQRALLGMYNGDVTAIMTELQGMSVNGDKNMFELLNDTDL